MIKNLTFHLKSFCLSMAAGRRTKCARTREAIMYSTNNIRHDIVRLNNAQHDNTDALSIRLICLQYTEYQANLFTVH